MRAEMQAEHAEEAQWKTSEEDGTAPGVAVHTNLKWWQAALLCIAEVISLGILSLPSVLATLGLVPGLLIIFGFGIVSTYSGYLIAQLKFAHPHLLNAPDCGRLLAGPVGYWTFALFQSLFFIFTCGVHFVTFINAMNIITNYGTCSIVFSVCGLVLFIVGSIPRSFKGVSYLATASFLSLMAAVLITMIALGVGYHPSELPPLTQRIDIFPQAVKFSAATSAAAQVGLAYGGHVTFFAIISDLKKPRDFKKSLLALQGIATLLYVLTAVLIYVFAGRDVPSPALGATSPIVRKVAYGIALVTIVGPGSILGHVNAKWMFQQTCYFAASRLDPTSRKGHLVWAACVVVTWVGSWIVAESIPNFNALLALISAIFISFFDFFVPSWGFFFLRWRNMAFLKGWKNLSLTMCNIFILIISGALFGLGVYGSGTQIHETASSGGVWTCASPS